VRMAFRKEGEHENREAVKERGNHRKMVLSN
ncbi:unnamed protein product, partial [marine sediment metagenome]